MREIEIRCKFVVSSRTTNQDDSVNLTAHAVYEGSEENKAYWKATPAGSLSLSIVNPDSVAHLQPGTEFYLEIVTPSA